MLFAKAGKYEACKMFTLGHFALIIITLVGIFIALTKTINKSKEEVFKIIRRLTVIMIILEVVKICFKLQDYKLINVKEWVPLYYCSLILYAGILSSFCKGILKRIGDVFIATGAIVGGVVFIIMPTTSLPTYPVFHFISLHSFFLHGTMIYLTILVNKTHYVELNKKDILYYAGLVGLVCIIALAVNIYFHSNLMFISLDFPNTPIHYIYKSTGALFTPIMIIAQMTLPYYFVYGIVKGVQRIENKKSVN